MNILTIVLWIIIALIGIISIVLVKMQFGEKKLEEGKKEKISENSLFDNLISSGKDKIKSRDTPKPTNSLYPNSNPTFQNDIYIEPQKEEIEEADAPAEETTNYNYEYENPNQVLIDYGNEVEKFQEPIKPNQMDIMTQNKDKTELKDLFTIDELIKESKRKDSEREKESQKISGEDEELDELKESIIKQKDEPLNEPLIEEIIENEIREGTITELLNDTSEEETISDLIDSTEEKAPEVEVPTSQKDIEEAISTASKESEKEEIESISESDNITDVLLNADEDESDYIPNEEIKEVPNEEIKEPALKTPSKVGTSIDDANLFEEKSNEMDLDYRKDLDKVANKIKGSKLFQEVKDKIVQEKPEGGTPDEETYIRNVNEYDEFAPIINETHIDFDASYEDLHKISNDEKLRRENTLRVFNKSKAPEPELATEKIGEIKSKPERDNIKIRLNNNEVVLKKGDEIIFNHAGETYSSQVFAINGDDISVRYRRQNITIKPEDVKKIY